MQELVRKMNQHLTVLEMKEQRKKEKNHSPSRKRKAMSEVNIQYVIKTIISQSPDMMEPDIFPPIVEI